MFEYEIRNGIDATRLGHMFGLKPDMAEYLRSEFGSVNYKRILRIPQNSHRFKIKQRANNWIAFARPVQGIQNPRSTEI